MEVKVIQQTKSLHYGGYQTHIFECIAVTHEIIEYKDRNNLLGIRSDRCNNENYDNGYIVGVPESFWFPEDKEIDPGHVLLVSMDRGNPGLEYLLCKDCKVYVTTKGQTIDIISI